MRESQGKTVYLRDYQVPEYLIDETDLEFSLHEGYTLVSSRLLLRRNPNSSTGRVPLVLNGKQLQLQTIKLDGKVLSADAYTVDAEYLTIESVPAKFTLECSTLIKPQENTSLEGLYKSRLMFCTQCEAEGFRKITYYLDRPDVLSSFTTRIEADKMLYPVLLSNGNKIAAGEVGEGRHFAIWQDPFLKPCYLFALVAGDLLPVTDNFTTCSGRTITLKIFVEPKDLDKCDFAMASLKKAMQWDEKVYGREYDLDIFMIVAVDDFNMGAMENKGLNIFNSSCVLAKAETSTDMAFQRIESIVAHEYFHNWSGNRVTCRDWFQLSLKEGFTVFRDAEFSADMGSRAVNRIEDVSFLRTAQFAEDTGPMAHSVRPESYIEISNFYTVTIYEKGSEVVRMIANLLGPNLFRKGTDLYFSRFDGLAVTTEDFVLTMEEVSGIDLTQFRLWYTQAGTPHLDISRTYDAKQRSFTLTVKQSCQATPGQPIKEPFFIPLTVGLLDGKGREIDLQCEEGHPPEKSKVLWVTEREQEFTFINVPETPIPAVLRGFSAPVKSSLDYSLDELMILMSYDPDGFMRWEAGQQLALQVIHAGLASWQNNKTIVVDVRLVTAFATVLESSLHDPAIDKAMVANLLLLPSEAYISELASEVDVDAIHHVREHIRKYLARELRELFGKVYYDNISTKPWQYQSADVAARSLKNTALNYLLSLADSHWIAAAKTQYNTANNMTDASAALRALVNNPSVLTQVTTVELLNHFYAKYKNEALVVEQWLSLQSAAPLSDNLQRVLELIEHEAFDIRNPNKVRSVIGAFCNSNAVGFHALNGEGYQFLGDYIIKLNSLNPQIAARQLTPLTRWRKYNTVRQELMKAQLIRIRSVENLSKDVFEVVSKSLQE